jgi:hypothetical protein
MMNRQTLALLCTSCFIASALVIALQREFIIICWSTNKMTQQDALAKNSLQKKPVKLFFWRNNAWHHETTEILASYDDKGLTISHLITRWLTLLDDEQIMKKPISLQSVLVSATGHEAYISFDRNPFVKDESAFSHWIWIEALLKTLRENGTKIQGVHFLVHHQPLNDYHLDFSRPWPLQGFFEQ